MRSFEGLKILLVEDNALNRQIATEMIELLGATVEIAENGNLAVDAVSSHPPFYFELVLMDVQMPVLNGYDATREIRHSGMASIDELPIIAMTANAFDDDIDKSKATGMNAHLAKPIEPDRLYQTLYDFIYEKEGSADENV